MGGIAVVSKSCCTLNKTSLLATFEVLGVSVLSILVGWLECRFWIQR